MNSVILVKGAQLILSLSILVILHEFGHYAAARIFKTRVERFFLFFDYKFSLLKKKIGDTTYGLGWIPFGGYVKISGMVDESGGVDATPPQPWEYRSKPAWQRLIIILGGIIVNIILAFVIFVFTLNIWGEKYIDPESVKDGMQVPASMEAFGFKNGDQILSVDGQAIDPYDINKYLLLRDVSKVEVKHLDGSVETLQIPDSVSNYIFKTESFISFRSKTVVGGFSESSPAQLAGLAAGDKVIALNGQPVQFLDELKSILQSTDKQSVEITLVRGADTISKALTLNPDKTLGIYFTNPDIKVLQRDYTFGSSLAQGINHGVWSIHDYAKQLKFLFTKKGATSIGGLGSIGGLFPSVWDWQQFWERTALLSVILAVMNLLPIPALDGGHVVFILYEMITRKKPNQKILEYAQISGVFVLIGLMIYANLNDIYKFFIK